MGERVRACLSGRNTRVDVRVLLVGVGRGGAADDRGETDGVSFVLRQVLQYRPERLAHFRLSAEWSSRYSRPSDLARGRTRGGNRGIIGRAHNVGLAANVWLYRRGGVYDLIRPAESCIARSCRYACGVLSMWMHCGLHMVRVQRVCGQPAGKEDRKIGQLQQVDRCCQLNKTSSFTRCISTTIRHQSSGTLLIRALCCSARRCLPSEQHASHGWLLPTSEDQLTRCSRLRRVKCDLREGRDQCTNCVKRDIQCVQAEWCEARLSRTDAPVWAW